eukprot:6521154-Prymnesium_polylepis.1
MGRADLEAAPSDTVIVAGQADRAALEEPSESSAARWGRVKATGQRVGASTAARTAPRAGRRRMSAPAALWQAAAEAAAEARTC